VHLLAQWARGRNVSRISVNGEIAVQLAAPALRIGDATVLLPPAAFLQPSREGEQLLQVAVLDMLAGARRVVDLFAGSGTFTLVLARQAKVHAVDSDKDALAALDAAARNATGLKPVTHETRDLFKRPLRLDELGRFDGAVIDPPRAGALTQAEMLAISGVDRIAYVSCNPDTFARDAAILTQQRFRLSEIRPVDQFLWSKHIELAGTFERQPGWSRRQKN
jgi:23S rRNA (uracil1939-C5)-methyltransferase